MRNFCVSYINFFDNDMHMRTISATNEINAVLSVFQDKYSSDNFEGCDTLEKVKSRAFDMDFMVGVIEIGSPL